jgi:hypothetical protein
VTAAGITRRGHALEWTAVAAAFAAVAAVVAVWLAADRRPPEWDHANHLERAVLCARDLERGDLQSVLLRSSFYPPVVPCAGGLAWRIAPDAAMAPQAAIVAFLGIGMAATYLLGRRLGGGAAGVVAALVFGTAPFVVWQALRFQLDLPLAAVVAVALEALLRTEHFRRTAWSLAAGAVMGLGMLTKPPFAVYLLPPVLLVLGRVRGRAAALNACGCAVLAVAVSLPWYGPRAMGIGHQVGARSFRQAAEAGHPDPLSAAGLLYYPTQIAVQVGIVGAVLLALGILVAVRRRAWLPLAALAPLAVFFLIQNKNLRYTQPLVPAAAAIAGLGWAALGRRARALAAVLVVAAGAVQVSSATFAVPAASRLTLLGLPLAIDSPPLVEDWRHREILARLVEDSAGAPATVSVVPNHAFFSVANFRYFGVRDGLALQFARAWDQEPIGVEYMITKTGDVGPEFTAEKPRRIAARLASDPYLARVFPVIGEWPLPDGSTAAVRARRLPRDLDVSPDRLAGAIERAFVRRLPEFAADVRGLDVQLDYDRDVLLGRVRRARVRMAEATVGELRRRGAARLRVHDLELVLDDVLVNPLSAHGAGRLDLLDIGRIRLARARIDDADFQAFLAGLKGFGSATVRLEEGALRFHLRQPGPDLEARVRVVAAADRPFALLSDGVRLGGVPVPGPLVDWVMRNFDPSLKIAARLPMPLEIGAVTISPAAARIGPDGR